MEVDLDADEAVGAEPADYIEWEYTRHDGGDVETMVKQRQPWRQRPRGRVQYDMLKDALAIVLEKGGAQWVEVGSAGCMLVQLSIALSVTKVAATQ